MTITEQFICGKHTAADCEDGIVITPHFAAVIDGSTSKTPLRLDASMKNGRFAMLLICDYIMQMAADSTMDHFCQGITHRIAEEYAGRGIAERMAEHPEERLTASAIVYSERRKEVWMVGDCQAIIDGKYYDNSKPYEHEIAMQRATLIKNGMAPKEARRTIEPQLIKAMLEGQNRQYAVIDGTPIYMPGTRIITVAHSVVLASDGYPTLLPTLHESEEALAKHLATDPQNITDFVATKGFGGQPQLRRPCLRQPEHLIIKTTCLFIKTKVPLRVFLPEVAPYCLCLHSVTEQSLSDSSRCIIPA